MNFVSKPITQLPEAESVTNDDKILVYKDTDGKAYLAAGTLFRGDAATINGVNALTIDAGDNITATQEGDVLHISATDTVYDTATTTDNGLMSAADKAKLDGIAPGAEVNVLESVSVNGSAVTVTNKTAALTLDKSTVGLGNVDNTTDANKPVSTAQQAALNLKVNISAVGAANGVAELDANGIIITSQLPSYVDDVLEYAAVADFPATGESGKIYVATS
ncbi:MAG: hypothetical protein IJT31_04870, partial [Oscillibacter sp.]|nr:hypothetical protein [Oscillibacter sp.]